MLLRTAVLFLTCLSASCVNTPDGSRPALGLSETSILETPPANLMVAEQTNFGFDRTSENDYLTLILKNDAGEEIFHEDLALRVIAIGRNVGHDLPTAREGLGWRLTVLADEGIADLERAQTLFRERNSPMSWNLNFGFKHLKPESIPEIVYMTYAIRLSPEDPWLTMVDNYPIYPEKSQDADTNTDRTEATP